MDQYYPAWKAHNYPEINTCLKTEFNGVLDYAQNIGLRIFK